MQTNTDKINIMEESSTKDHQNKKMDEEVTNCSTIKSSINNTSEIEGSHTGQSEAPQQMKILQEKDVNSSQNRQMGQEVNINFQRNNLANYIDNPPNERSSSQLLNQMLRRQQIFRQEQMSHRYQMFHRGLQEEFSEDESQQKEQNQSGQTLLHVNFKQFDVDCRISSNATIRQVKSFIRYSMLQYQLLPDIQKILLMQKTERGLTKYLIDKQQKIGSVGNGKEINIIVSQIGIRSIINLEF